MTVYADWPLLDELKQVLDVTSEEWDGDLDQTRLTAVLEAAIEYVKKDVGVWNDYEDVPTIGLSRAALRLAELLALRPESGRITATDTTVAEEAQDPTYQRYMFGARRRFGIG